MSGPPDWREGHRILADRIARLPERLRETAAEQGRPLDLDAGAVGSFVLTGIGSSAAHARFLRHHLAALGLPTRFAQLSEFAAGPPGGRGDVLIVFSQGLSPNARLALLEPGRWKKVVLVTAVRRGLGELEDAGVVLRHFPEEDEFGTLVRIVGPFCGYWRALELAREIAARSGRPPLPELDVEMVCERVRVLAGSAPVPDLDWLDYEVALVTSGSYGELVGNLQYKLLEGCLRPMPPVWDLLEVAHGPLQEAVSNRRSFLVLTRAGAPGEADLLTRLRAVLDPDLHRVVVLHAALPDPYPIFEHEAMLDAVCLRWIEERELDQVRWPGRGADRPLYEVGARPAARRLDLLTWPEIDRLVASGRRTAVVPLGATEQHGPHLPLAVDSWIADALAERLCARVPEAVRLPALTLGCSPEHLEFSGTLSLDPATFAAVLEDLLRSLRRHGFERAFLFTAHGGNAAPLREALPRLREAAAPLRVEAFVDLDRVTGRLFREAAALGVTVEAAGHHAGEIETSILLALDPAAVRRESLAPGRLEPAVDAQSLFHPSLRPNAPGGTVGDPSLADAARAERYLAAWTGLLVEAYDEAFSRDADE